MTEPFVTGSAVVTPDASHEKDPFHWIDLIRRHKVSSWNSVPALFEMLVESEAYTIGEDFTTMRNIFLGGEIISVPLIKKAMKIFKNATFTNCGGPSETTIWNIWHTITQEDIKGSFIPYGKPLVNTNYYILSDEHEICPPYKEGTMYVEGVGVAEGYINLEAETKSQFVTIFGKRMYNTGDRGFYLSNGNIKILGRADRQVKINGKRIELEGISEAMKEVKGIISSAIIINERKNIIAFYTASSAITEDEITNVLKRKLSTYMIPVKFIKLENMPLTKNGKIDVKALSEIDVSSIVIESSNSGERNSALEAEILEMCKEILCNDDITVNDSFFEMGGNSIHAIKLLTQIQKKYGVYLTIYDILNTPEVSYWSNLIVENNK